MFIDYYMATHSLNLLLILLKVRAFFYSLSEDFSFLINCVTHTVIRSSTTLINTSCWFINQIINYLHRNFWIQVKEYLYITVPYLFLRLFQNLQAFTHIRMSVLTTLNQIFWKWHVKMESIGLLCQLIVDFHKEMIDWHFLVL